MKFNLIIIILIILTLINEKKIKSQNIEENVVNVSVNGLVCDFCARSIEKLFNKEDSVEKVNIDLERMLITINLKQGRNLSNNIIRELVMDSGYDVIEINRDD